MTLANFSGYYYQFKLSNINKFIKKNIIDIKTLLAIANKFGFLFEQGDEGTHVAIYSITAIPYSDWSVDLITPSPVCVIRNGHCVQSTFLVAPDSKKVNINVKAEWTDSISINNGDNILLNFSSKVISEIDLYLT